MQRFCLVAAAQEIGMERVNRLAGLDRARGRDHRLSDHLTAEDAIARRGRERGKDEFVLDARNRIEFEQPRDIGNDRLGRHLRSEEHTSELQSLMRISYAVFCVKKKTRQKQQYDTQ